MSRQEYFLEGTHEEGFSFRLFVQRVLLAQYIRYVSLRIMNSEIDSSQAATISATTVPASSAERIDCVYPANACGRVRHVRCGPGCERGAARGSCSKHAEQSGTCHPDIQATRARRGGLGWALKARAARLASGLTYRMAPLTDAEKGEALAAHARSRGFELSDEVSSYLLTHARRDMGSLMSALDAIDRYSLESRRAVTVPLLKEALGRPSPRAEGANEGRGCANE